MITPAQCRAGRALLDIGQKELSDLSSVGLTTIKRFEGGLQKPNRSTMLLIRQALEARGVRLLGAHGVALPPETVS
ncbi:transcriptional regulator [Oceanibaculum indicum]|uniref:Helix-turn-helix protein n=1 Tax=Oceanibaculum indicum TaxID=526216 RepID=A0A420WGI9_9PROT|nr:transcriptional regulator [Oceanibaculum indicum]RKQ70110.1 hypothetical protein BCL74_2049 [Oceanibaculum indicum]